MATKLEAESCVPFPDGDWNEGVRELIYTPSPFLEIGWKRSARPQDPPAEKGECACLVESAKLRTATKIKEIDRQAFRSLTAIQPVQKLIAEINFPPKHAVKKLIGVLLDNIQGPIYYFKDHFSRNRPHVCCMGLDPMFKKPHRAHPGHPAYPSGHATMAYAVAYMYIAMFDKDTAAAKPLLDAAAGVAKNREIASLHYPSDSEAGRALAEALVKLLIASPIKVDGNTFSDLMKAAKDDL